MARPVPADPVLTRILFHFVELCSSDAVPLLNPFSELAETLIRQYTRVYRMKTLSTKVHPGTEEAIEEYRTEHGISRSAAIRRLITTGLEAEEQPRDTISMPLMIIWIGSLLATATYVTGTSWAGIVGVGMMVIGFALTRDRVIRILNKATSSQSPQT